MFQSKSMVSFGERERKWNLGIVCSCVLVILHCTLLLFSVIIQNINNRRSCITTVFLIFWFLCRFLGDFPTLWDIVVMQDLWILKEQQVSKTLDPTRKIFDVWLILYITATIPIMTTIKTNFPPKMVVLWRCKMRFPESEVGRSGIASKTVAALMVATMTTFVVCFKPPASTPGRGYEPPWNLHAP